MKKHCVRLTSTCALFALSASAAINIDLGAADAFAVLGASTITNTGLSVVTGNLGVAPGSSITGFPAGIVNGTIHSADAVALQAKLDLSSAYDLAAVQPCNTSLTGQDLGGLNLTPGVYCYSSSAQLTGTLTLDAQGNPNAVFIFQIGSTLTTASASSVQFANNGQGGSVYWQVGSSATLGTTTQFTGNILASESITLNSGASIDCGRALAQNGAVSMDTNAVSIGTPGCLSTSDSPVPEPQTAGLLGLSFVIGAILFHRRRVFARCS
jgi:hypothetical protein